MKLHPRVSKTAVELVKRFEGLRRRAARLPDGGWTIGYGHTLTAREGVEVTPDEAELLLYYDLSEVATKVEAWTFTPLSQNQFEALTAFAFNIGLENFRRSTVLKRVNEGQHLQAAAAMELWRKAEVGGEGVVADALVRRRAAEKAHYLTPPEGFAPSPSQVLRPVFDHSVIEAAAQIRAGEKVAVVTAPLDGPMAEARVERPAAPEPVVPEPVAPKPTAPEHASPAVEAGAAAVLAAAAEVLHAPPAKAPPAGPAPVNDSHPLQDLPFPPAPSAPEPVLADEPVIDRRGAADEGPNPFEVPPTDHPGDFNLFDRPLAPPEPTRFGQPVGPALAIGDKGVLRAAAAKRSDRSPPAFLHDRTVVFSAIGLLGVALFALAIITMLVGKATISHLLIGCLGVALITPAGVFFLMQRMGGVRSSRR